MWGVYGWASKFLIAVMLAPSIGPLTMPCAVLPVETHLSAKNEVSDSAQPMMHCHHAMAGADSEQAGGARPNASAASGKAIGGAAISSRNCCESHCCCGAMTSEWAQPTANALHFVSPFIEAASIPKNIGVVSTDDSDPDSTRAPPRG